MTLILNWLYIFQKKEMDSGSIIGVIIVLICVLPLVMLYRSRKKREKKSLQSLVDLAEKSNCRISEHEFWNDSAIGIDDAAGMLFFIRNAKGHETVQQVNLAKIRQCRVVKTQNTVSSKDSNYKVISKLELAFAYQDKRPDVVWEFYNTAYDSLTLSGELQIIEKWSKIVNDKITELTKKR